MNHFLKAAVLFSPEEPLRICRMAVPPLQDGQVLVKILYSGVCRSQLMEARGKRGHDRWLPHMLGHEGTGLVMDVGSSVNKVKKDDMVILSWVKGEGIDAPGAIYSHEGKKINSGPVTTFSNYTIASENRLTLKPPQVSQDVGVLFGCAIPTGAGMVFNQITISPHSSYVVIGLGGIGLCALMALKARHAQTIIAVDISEDKLKKAKSLGATHTLRLTGEALKEAVLKITRGGADFCIESAGTISTIESGFDLLNPKTGTLIFASHPPEGEQIRLSPHELISGKTILGSWGGGTHLDRDTVRMADSFIQAGTPLESLLTRCYELEQINDALADLELGRVFRPLIKMTH